MKKLIIVRHGDYGYDRCLNDSGKQQITSLAQKLRGHINGDKALILSSPADRVRESAEILAEQLEIMHELHEILWSDCDHTEDMEGTLALVCEKKKVVDILILVTHLEYGESFPSYFAKEELEETSRMFNGYGIQKGQAWVIDCQQKVLERVTP